MPSQVFLCLNEVKKIERQNKGEILANKNFNFLWDKKSDRVMWNVGRGEGGKKEVTSLSIFMNKSFFCCFFFPSVRS